MAAVESAPAAAPRVYECANSSCVKPATMKCPTCLKLPVAASIASFCGQECFKAVWTDHKACHAAANAVLVQFDGYDFSGKLRPKMKSAYRPIPDHIQKPDYWETGDPLSEREFRGKSGQIVIHSEEVINKMRRTCRLAREVLDIGAAAAKPGVTTDEIDRIVHEAAIERECYPSALNYRNFPKSCCTSINESICHGIPDGNELNDGDLLKLDVTLFHEGVHGDLCETYAIGNVSEKHRALAQTSYDSLQDAIKIAKPETFFRDLGTVIQKRAHDNGFSVVRSYCGHGISDLFHTTPNIPHYAKNKAIGIMKPGMIFTIEPMINEGNYGDRVWPDDWTVVTPDGKWSAQFEHTMVVTQTGVEVLTARLPTSRSDFV